MRLHQILILSLRALRRNPLRTFLTTLGMIIGIGAVITLVGIGNGARGAIAAQIATLGENLLMILPGSANQGGVRTGAGGRMSLKAGDAAAIVRDVPDIRAICPEVRARTQVVSAGHNWNTIVIGTSPDYEILRNRSVAEGKMFDDDDVTRSAKVAVVGQTIADQLFPEGQDPLGRMIRIGRSPFRIVGVLAPKGYSRQQDEDDLILVPYTSHLHRISRRDYLDSIVASVSDPKLFGPVTQRVEDLLFARHRIHEGETLDVTVRNQDEILQRATAATETMTYLLASIASVSLLVGGIGIMNIMLVSVTERTREIGIRLAIGAHERDVLGQFLCEAIILSLIGGVLGVLGGLVASEVFSHVYQRPVDVSLGSIVAAVGFSAVIGIFFGYYPARRAAQLEPIHALRFE